MASHLATTACLAQFPSFTGQELALLFLGILAESNSNGLFRSLRFLLRQYRSQVDHQLILNKLITHLLTILIAFEGILDFLAKFTLFENFFTKKVSSSNTLPPKLLSEIQGVLLSECAWWPHQKDSSDCFKNKLELVGYLLGSI